MNDLKLRVLEADTLIVGDGICYSPGRMVIDTSTGKVVSVGEMNRNKDEEREEEVEKFPILIPGFVDLHTHGPCHSCSELLESWLHIDEILSNLCQKGVTSCLAAVTFPSKTRPLLIQETASVLESFYQLPFHVLKNRASFEGVYAEGPAIATQGGLPDSNEILQSGPNSLLKLYSKSLKLMTISPSIDGKNDHSFDWTRAMLSNGIGVALGHDTKTKQEDIFKMLHLGNEFNFQPMHITHLFNVQSLHHRNMGIANFGLVNSFPRLREYENLKPPTVEIIGDLIHVDALMLKTAIDSRKGSISLITDAIASQGQTNITYDGRELEIINGRAVVKGTDLLCGSIASMLDLFKNAISVIGCDLITASQMVSESPAKAARIYPYIGCLKVGSRGDFVAFDRDLNNIQCVAVAGRTVYKSK